MSFLDQPTGSSYTFNPPEQSNQKWVRERLPLLSNFSFSCMIKHHSPLLPSSLLPLPFPLEKIRMPSTQTSDLRAHEYPLSLTTMDVEMTQSPPIIEGTRSNPTLENPQHQHPSKNEGINEWSFLNKLTNNFLSQHDRNQIID